MMSCLYILLLIFLTIAAATTPPPYIATDLILLNCGESRSSIDSSNRSWEGDAGPRYSPWNFDVISSASPASYMHPSTFLVPYKTARVFQSPFTYRFPVSPGQKFLRLYFYPDIYSGLDTSHSLFSVTASFSVTLLKNFSAYLYSKNTSKPSFFKEFVVSVGWNKRLDLTFTPNSDSFAFVNGIEIVSMPDNLYFQEVPIIFQNREDFDLSNDTALETMYRLNVGGGPVDIQDDSGMFRRWLPDDDHIYGPDHGYTDHNVEAQVKDYFAPGIVYTTARVMGNTSLSLEWIFQVDSGFNYLLRLHYWNYNLFRVNINNKTYGSRNGSRNIGGTRRNFDDYIAWDYDRRGKQDLRLSLYPYNPPAGSNDSDPEYYSAVKLNGLEMFKLNDSISSLAAANPDLAVDSSITPSSPRIKEKSVVYAVIGSVIGGAAVFAVSFLILRRRWRRVKVKSPRLSLPSDLCKYFSIKEIKTATANFDHNFVIGRGGFGNVYKGLIDDDAATTVAIKRLNPSSDQGAREFLTEIEMLSKLRHLHLVSLIGYCDDGGEMILVYDYLPHGTLRDHLYNSNNPPLPWIQRLQICLGAAKGLDYLHTCTKNSIIHRDVKTTNILLDDKWIAKVSDFGLSKVGPAGLHSHVSTAVKGSFGYMDPEYYRRQQLTNKSDVYSFGVVLFEVLCARPAVLPSLPLEQANLADWARFCYRENKIEQIIDSNLKSQIAPECLTKFVETAVACLGEHGIDRPSMNDVVRSLEISIELQLSADGDGAVSPSLPLIGDEEVFLRCSEITASKNSDFSEIINPIGR